MSTSRITRPASLLFTLFALCCSLFSIAPSAAAADTIKTLSIEGHVYELVLNENTELTSRLSFRQDRKITGTHYRGQLKNFPDSWVRASLIEDHLQGVVSISGAVYILDRPAEVDPALQRRVAEARISDLSATPVASLEPRACGVEPVSLPVTAATEAAEPASALRVAREVAYSSLCATTINGTCLIAELELAFDADFVAEFSDAGEAADQALALVNITEGFYLNDFDISFETLSLELLDNNVSPETGATDLLNDIADAKDGGVFTSLQNTRSLFHFVTGRDLDGGTAGIAFLGELCTTNAVGVTSLLDDFIGFPNIPLTGIVMAHEIGHNFDADHDGEQNACGSGFIMEAAVNSSTSEFSSCSISEITNAIEDVANPALCFNFPADAGITAANDNPAEVTRNEEFTSNYTVATRHSFEAIPTLVVNGSIPPSQGQFTSVTLSGQGCNLGSQGQTYSCNLTSPGAAVTLQVNAIASDTAMNLTHTTALAGSSDIRDVDDSNDQLVAAFTVVAGLPPAAPSNLVGVQGNATDVSLSWQDNSDNETSFSIERRLLGGTFSELAQVSLDITSFTDTTSTENNSYEYRVSASNGNGASAPSETAQVDVTAPVSPPLTAPSGLVAEQGDDTEVNLNWQDNSNNETGFVVQRRLLGGTFAELMQLGANVTSFVDVTTTATNTYEYQVFARNDNGSSAATAIAQVEVTAPAVVAPPSIIGSGDEGGGGGSMHWSMLICLAGLAWRRLRNNSRRVA